ncbi:sperm microtubule inner protein 11-like [Branchiostoma floridae x Branchiostoma belcheri]
MAFFGITGLGYQDAIKEKVLRPAEVKSEGLGTRGVDTAAEVVGDPGEGTPKPFSPAEKVNPSELTSGDPQGSYVKYTTMLRKHIRNPHAPNQLNRLPQTEGQCVGFWHPNKGEPAIQQQLPWTRVPRYGMVTSEMTRFVDQMAVTNKEFRLF